MAKLLNIIKAAVIVGAGLLLVYSHVAGIAAARMSRGIRKGIEEEASPEMLADRCNGVARMIGRMQNYTIVGGIALVILTFVPWADEERNDTEQ